MILAIDTTGDKKSIALYWPKKLSIEEIWDENKIDPLEKIDILLKSNKLHLKDIKYIVVNRGPGSFTGIRIGITIANTLSESLNIPIIGIQNKNNLDIIKLAKNGYEERNKAQTDKLVFPYYGKEPKITSGS